MLSFFLVLVCMQSVLAEPSADWSVYDRLTRRACRQVDTKQEYGALLYAQLVLMSEGQLALIASEMHVVELRRRSMSTGDVDGDVLLVLRALQTERERIEERIAAMEREARMNARAVTPRNFPVRFLRRRCRDSFADTRDDMRRTLAVLYAQDAELSQIPLVDPFSPPPD